MRPERALTPLGRPRIVEAVRKGWVLLLECLCLSAIFVTSCASQDASVSTPAGGGGNHTTGGKNRSPSAAIDAGPDAGLDAGGSPGGDAGQSQGDAGAVDAGPVDAGPADAGLVWPPPAGSEICPAGSVHFTDQLLTFGPCVPGGSSNVGAVDGVQVTTLVPWGATTSSDGGYFTLCAPSGTPFTAQFIAPQFATSYLAELTLDQDENLSNSAQLYLLCDTLVSLFKLQDANWNFNGQGSVLAGVISASGKPPCTDPTNLLAGWHVQSALPDGGEIAGPTGWPVAYLDAAGEPNSSVWVTYQSGYAVVYNIDASVDAVTLYFDGGPPGASCPTSNPALGFDGIVHTQPDTFGLFPYVVP